MRDTIVDFLVSIGFAADDGSRRRAEGAVAGFEKTVTESDRRTTKARLREALIREASDADTFEKRVKHAERLEEIDGKFGGLMLRRTLRQAAAQAQTNEERVKWLDRLQKAEADHHARSVSGLQRLAGVATSAAVVITAATMTLATYATTVAAKLEAMAYAADRTGSTVASLKIFSQAVSQLGGTAGGALNDLEAFAGKLRSNPQGYTAFLRSIGVEARDAQGNLRGAAELYKEFRKNVGERKPYEQQLLYAQEMGVSEQTWRATDPAKLAAEEAAQRAKYGRMNYDPDKAAEGAKNLQHALRDIFDSINIIGEKTAAKIFADVGDNLKSFTIFLEQHGDQIAEILSKVAQMVLAVSKALLEMLTSEKVKAGLDWLLGMFGHVEEGSGKWIADTERIKGVLEALATFIATVFVAKITGGIRDIIKELAPLLTMLAPFAGVLGLPALGTAVVGGALVAGSDPSKGVTHGGRPDGALNPGDELPGAGGGTPSGGGEGAWARAKRLGRAALNAVGLGGGSGVGAGAARIGKLAQNQNAQAIIGELRKVGYNDHAIAAVVGSMRTESTFNPGAHNNQSGGHDGLWQWDSTRWPKIKKWITDQGGNPNDAAWQTRAWIAEHNAKPGDAIYDNRKTQQGGDILKNNPSLEDAIAGVRMSERFGAGEEGGRAANARNWLPHVSAPSATAAPSGTLPNGLPAILKPDSMRDAPGVTMAESERMRAARDAARAFRDRVNEGVGRLEIGKLRAIGSATEGFNPAEYLKSAPPVGTSTTNTDASVRHQSYNRGDSTVNIYTTADARETHDLWRRHEDRQKADDLRHAASVFA